MNFLPTKIPDVFVCQPKIFEDERGYFTETFRQDKLEEHLGHEIDFCQDNESKSTYGVLRGLHFQSAPFTQTKLVRVLEGSVLDVAVDLRKSSPYFGQSVAVELSAENKKQLFVPRGFAHGFVVLSKTAIFAYKCDNYYHPESEVGLRYDDASLNIDWQLPKADLILSNKDLSLPNLEDIVIFEPNVQLY
ncbi:MAG: dTDP-4-dehydrorhamnose 3,5-epimerase [Leeuwenhoekiella sp.]